MQWTEFSVCLLVFLLIVLQEVDIAVAAIASGQAGCRTALEKSQCSK